MRLKNILLFCIFAVCMMLTITTAAASIFEHGTVPIQELNDNPEMYDSTTAYRKISTTGNVSELAINSIVITQGDQTLQIKEVQQSLFSGFEIGDGVKLTGEFRYDPIDGGYFVPNYVIHQPSETVENATIQHINANPADFNGKFLTITADLKSIDESVSRYVVTVADNKTGHTMKITFYGSTDLEPGALIEVSGLYNDGILYSENMGKYKSGLSLTTLIPGFSGLSALLAIGIMGILVRRKHPE